MAKETVKLTRSSMQLLDDKSFAKVRFSDDEDGNEEKKPILEMTAYSGGIIKNHWFWGDLAIDLNGMSFPKGKFPILEEHETAKRIGFATKMSIENNQLTVAEATFLNTPEAISFKEQSAAGFPFEASIYAKPSKIQTLQEGEVADVNGYQMTGPATIWRTSTFKEASVCTFGYDSNTRSAAMSEDEDVIVEYTTKFAVKPKKEESMDYIKFKTEHPEEFAKLAKEVADGIEAKFAEEKAALEAQLAEVQTQNTKLSEENKDGEKRLLALEKAEAIRAEQNLKHTADTIFAEKFKEAGLPDRLSEKVRKLTSHEAFVADGKLDVEAFSTAIDTELKDWTNDDGSVLGFSTSNKSHGESDASTKASDAAAARMLAYVK
jgi:hypothetical protein